MSVQEVLAGTNAPQREHRERSKIADAREGLEHPDAVVGAGGHTVDRVWPIQK